jgi:starch phosphorylase
MLKLCNVRLSDLISKHIGDGWVTDLYELKKLIPLARDKNSGKSGEK